MADGSPYGVNNVTAAIEVPSLNGSIISLSDTCVEALIWPVQRSIIC